MIEAERGYANQDPTDLPPGVNDPNIKLVKLDRKKVSKLPHLLFLK